MDQKARFWFRGENLQGQLCTKLGFYVGLLRFFFPVNLASEIRGVKTPPLSYTKETSFLHNMLVLIYIFK